MTAKKSRTAAPRVKVAAPSPAYPTDDEKRVTIEDLRDLIAHHEGALTLVIAPDVAEKALAEFNTGNRRLGEARAQSYADVMAAHDWLFTGENLIFSKTALNTGQHRLRATVLYGKPIRFSVMFGVQREAFVVTDTGRSHNSADVLAVRGVTNNSMVAATLRWILAYEEGLPEANNNTVGPAAVNAAIDRWPEIVAITTLFVSYKWSPGIRLASNNAVAFFAIKVHGEEKAREFLSILADGATSNKNHPARMLRERLMKDKSAKTKMNPVARFALAIKSLNAFTEGEEVYQLRMRETGDKKEAFPVVLGLKL